jgi:hypothetical protein
MQNRLRLSLATLAVLTVVGGAGAAIANAASGNSSSGQSQSSQSQSNQNRSSNSGNCPNM